MSIHDFPRCAGYLKAMRVNINDPEMTDYWFGVVVSDAFTDAQLIKDGSINFETMAGDKILSEFERLLADMAQRRANNAPAPESLKALLGSRGVKVSRLDTADDYWQVACLLWPTVIRRGSDNSFQALMDQIKAMSKKQRKAACNRNAIPTEWRGAV